jgi:hypothetical protein
MHGVKNSEVPNGKIFETLRISWRESILFGKKARRRIASFQTKTDSRQEIRNVSKIFPLGTLEIFSLYAF